MDARDLRIKDIIAVKTDSRMTGYQIDNLSAKYADIQAVVDSNELFTDLRIADLVGIPITDFWLDVMGAVYDAVKVEYAIPVKCAGHIFLRPSLGEDTFIVVWMYKKRQQYKKITYIHELQHFVWDTVRADIF